MATACAASSFLSCSCFALSASSGLPGVVVVLLAEVVVEVTEVEVV